MVRVFVAEWDTASGKAQLRLRFFRMDVAIRKVPEWGIRTFYG